MEAVCPGVPSLLDWDIEGRGFTRFRATAAISEDSRRSDINPALRFFVFTSRPDPERLVRVEGSPPLPADAKRRTPAELAGYIYQYLLARRPSSAERGIAEGILTGGGRQASAAGLEDFLWALLMSPEFQFIH